MPNTTYLVTARKYRPLLFKDLVAQEHVTETLKNAIRLDRLAHAYMFAGPRGVGKTTAARILAKAINCTSPLEDREDRAEPCRECVSCKSFEESRNMNIIEIDAASNNKVDDIRDLRETVRIPPQANRMKVYIIDEVHMLSNAAFNALLKTLEEPPPHAMFIFATTEPHKVLPTIQSRCQRFDFRRITTQESVDRLRVISELEGISVDDAALMLIARKGDGALRDALSVFDQAVSLCGTTINYSELVRALGVVDTDMYFDVTLAVSGGNSAQMILIVDRIVRAGYDLQEFVEGLAEHCRNLLVAITVKDSTLIEATEADRTRILDHGQDFSESTLLSLIQIIGEVADSLRLSRQPRLKLEMALLRMASLPDSLDIRSALDKLSKLEKMAAAGEIRLIVETKAPPVTAPVDSLSAVVEPPTVPSPPEPTIQEVASIEAPRSAPTNEEPVSEMTTEPLTSVPPPAAATPSKAAHPDPAPESSPSLFVEPPAIKKTRSGPDSQAVAAQDEDVLVLEDYAELSTEERSDSLAILRTAWETLISQVMESEKQLGSFLRQAHVHAFEGHIVLLTVPDEFHARALRSERTKLAHRLTVLADLKVDRIAFRIESVSDSDNSSPDSESDAREALERMCDANPAVRALVERFGGEIVW